MDYRVLTDSDYDDFKKIVMQHLADGYELQGGVFVLSDNGTEWFYQAVVKKEEQQFEVWAKSAYPYWANVDPIDTQTLKDYTWGVCPICLALPGEPCDLANGSDTILMLAEGIGHHIKRLRPLWHRHVLSLTEEDEDV